MEWLTAIAVLAVGCGGATLPGRAGSDAAVDGQARTDGSAADATRDATRSPDATVDAQPDAKVDAIGDAPHPPTTDARALDASTCAAPLGLCPASDGGPSVCVDFAANSQNCGACGVVCVAGDVCNAGTCALTCTPGTLTCDGGCVDPATSVAYCGAVADCAGANAGTACGPTSACVAGVCVPLCDGGACGTCPANLTACGMGCTDLASDGANCGACGHDCLGGGCLDGTCQPVVLAAGTGPIAIDAENVYFQASGTDDVVLMRVPKAGGNPVAITAVPLDGGAAPMVPSHGVGLQSVAVSATDAYFLTSASQYQNGPELQGILTVPLDGGARSQFVPESEIGDQGPALVSFGPDLGTLVVDGPNLYWTGSNGVGFAPLAGGPVTYLAGGPPGVDAGGLGAPGGPLAVGSTQVIWGTQFGIFSVPMAGGTVSTLVAPPSMPRAYDPQVSGVAQDGTNVYWSNPSAGAILAERLSGGAVTVLASSRTSPGAVVTDGEVVVWVDLEGLFRVPVSGGSLTQMFTQGAAAWLAMDATRVYFVTSAGVVRVAR